MNTANTIEDFSHLFHKELNGIYPKDEIDAFIFMAMEEIVGITRDKIRTGKDQLIKPQRAVKLQSLINNLKTQKPIQYILGTTEFYGCKLKVNEHVLIPRPETEELVHLIAADTKSSELKVPNLLDIGTGSGCIAIALKKKLPNANVTAIDVSEEALLVARANALLNKTEISFMKEDILQANWLTNQLSTRFDIIVSNPPYIRFSEKDTMKKNVLEHEPHIALFVNDKDPLLFYRHISDFALRHLNSKGKLYFEINEALGSDVKQMMEGKGFEKVEVKKDISGKDRIAFANKQ